jgi:hypothetical protein
MVRAGASSVKDGPGRPSGRPRGLGDRSIHATVTLEEESWCYEAHALFQKMFNTWNRRVRAGRTGWHFDSRARGGTGRRRADSNIIRGATMTEE